MKLPNHTKSILSYWRLALGGTFLCTGLALTFIATSTMTTSVSAGSAQSAGFYVSQIPLAGTSSALTGDSSSSGDTDVTHAEWAGQLDNSDGSPGPFPEIVVNRSLSHGVANGVSVTAGKKAKSNPQVNLSFFGLNHYQQRYSRKGNQFSVEPPDQGMCVGNGFVVEAVNDVFNVFSATTGASLLPDNTATNIVSGHPRDVNHSVDLNSFFGYAPAINRSTGVRGPFVTDPSCLYDAAAQRFFLVALTLETRPNGSFTHVNHLDSTSRSVRRLTQPAAGTSITSMSRTTVQTRAA